MEYKYCTQTLIYTDKTRYEINIDQIRKDLQRYGDSLMVVGSDRIVKVHIHTNHPGVVLESALNYGSLNDINIDNMEIQNEDFQEHHHPELEEEIEGIDEEKEANTPVIESESEEDSDNNQQSAEPGDGEEIGIIAVGKGQGIKNIFKQLSVDMVIDGGQSMNPSTNDFVEAIAEISSNKILILPNNKNIISAAQQASSLADKEVEVVPTRSIPQAISSLLAFNGEVELSLLKENMEQEIESVKTLEITTAVKNSRVNGLEIEEGDIIGLYNDDIVVAGDSYQEVVLDLLIKTKQDEELMTIYYGEEITEDEVGDLLDYIHREIDIEEIETYNGGQPLYPYIISLE
ncbi:MAG: DAK2 domain-containing protein [Bacillota bacterium]